MKTTIPFRGSIGYTLTACIVLLLSYNVKAQQQLFNQNWEFIKGNDTVYHSLQNAKNWQKINLPHTANIEPVVKTQQEWQGICFYRKSFNVTEGDRNKHIALQFDAAMQKAIVYLNGKPVFSHVGGYLPFYVDISKDVKYGQQNEIVVRLDNRDDANIAPGKPLNELDFNYYSGIYRNVYLIKKDQLYISNPIAANRKAGGGVLLHYDNISNESTQLSVQTDVDNASTNAQSFKVQISFQDHEGKTLYQEVSASQSVQAGSHLKVNQQIKISRPKLWSPESPYLYQIKIELLKGSNIIEQKLINTGIRSILLKNKTLYLNGQPYRLRGTNRHQEYPYIGYALSDNAQYRDAKKIKEAGFNFVRLSHYPQSTAFLSACDELGLLVMNAIPGWQFFGKEEFVKNTLQDVRDMVRRDRNHPSILLWEASLNESGMNKAFMQKAHQAVNEELPFADTYTAGWKDDVYDVFIPARQHAKAPHYWRNYSKDKPILISEYGDWEYYAHNAGFNQKEYENLQPDERTSRQLRKHGERRLLQQALNYQEAHNDNLYGNYLGDANWLMFDYKRGYAMDIESSGIMDIMRLPKFSYWFYKSQQSFKGKVTKSNQPVLFIANYWQNPADSVVKIYSNLDEVKLYLNGKFVGQHKPDTGRISVNLKHPPFIFHVPAFEKGNLKAVGYLKGKKMFETIQNTAESPHMVSIEADYSGKSLQAGKNDVLLVYAYVKDAKKNQVFDASNSIHFEIESGDAEIIGQKTVNAEAGIASVLVRAGSKAGTIKVSAVSEGLKSDKLSIKSIN